MARQQKAKTKSKHPGDQLARQLNKELAGTGYQVRQRSATVAIENEDGVPLGRSPNITAAIRRIHRMANGKLWWRMPKLKKIHPAGAIERRPAAPAPVLPRTGTVVPPVGGITLKDAGYDWVKATRLIAGTVRLNYQVRGLPTQGSDAIDEDTSAWSDFDVKRTICQMLGINEKCAGEIDFRDE